MAAKPSELKIHQPPTFDGERTKVESFIRSCKLYLHINDKIYDDNEKKVAFVLSFMTEGNAQSWADDFLNTAFETTPATLGTITELYKKIKDYFEPADAVQKAIASLASVEQEPKESVEDYVAKFRLLVTASAIKEFPVLKHHFLRGLNRSVTNKVVGVETAPTTMEKYYALAIRFDANYHAAQAYNADKSSPRRFTPKTNSASSSQPRRISRLTDEERTKLAKEGKCFRCREQGHIAADCPKNTPSKQSPAKIRAMIMELSEEERKEILDTDF